ncbi:hypothetical protein JAAARDRAFT_169006 [Jaapia argillacea MUCL 33604]|uniref:Lipase-like C-terminal domain-containing protein n=1 Tax=Jaapia argillacea MUCL 33604 TaxID=933084 RepID=A0A067QL20_9AGAM|nr:hypothetical protein JAAARDRAFT_169006 [Jaapia argillacea MUCL 33604]
MSSIDALPRLLASDEPPPLVIVEGFLGGFGNILQGAFEKHLNTDCEGRPRKTIFASSVGPVSSLHDRACELFYALMGGTGELPVLDYGEQHAIEHKHRRFGRNNHCGLYPLWSRERPLHFLGHSLGGPTIVKLQSLLRQGFFGIHLRPDMILSVNALSAPFRGTPLTYVFGESTTNAPSVRQFSLGSLLTKAIHLVAYFSPLLPSISSFYLLSPLDMHIEARHLTMHDITLKDFFRQMWRSDWGESRDAAPYDVTFDAADEREAEGTVLQDGTFYRSYVACMTQGQHEIQAATLQSYLLWPGLHLTSRAIMSFDYPALHPPPSFVSLPVQSHSTKPAKRRNNLNLDLEKASGLWDLSASIDKLSEEYFVNDGVVPMFSQFHPHHCCQTRCRHYPPNGIQQTDIPAVESGLWHVHTIPNAHHLSLLPAWNGTDGQRSFWEDLGRWLRAIDAQVSHQP